MIIEIARAEGRFIWQLIHRFLGPGRAIGPLIISQLKNDLSKNQDLNCYVRKMSVSEVLQAKPAELLHQFKNVTK